MTKDQIVDELNKKGAGEENIKSIVNILETCDFARFAPSSSTLEEMKNFLEKAENAIVEIERQRLS